MGQIKIPRITTVQRIALTLDVGELVYDTTNGGVYKGDGVTAGGVALGGGSGTVTSVAATVPTFLSVAGSPITSSGTLAVTLSGTALPVANGGTGVTTSTGSGNTVLSISPVLTTPNIGSATGSISGNAATVTTNANLTGHITSVGNAAVLGSFTSAQLGAALTDETGTGVNVFATSPTLVTPILGSASATALTFSSTTVSGLTINKLTTAQRQALTPTSGDVVYDTTIGTTCTYNGTFWDYTIFKKLTSDFSTTSITMVTVTGFTFPVEANSTYLVEGVWLVGTSNTSGYTIGNDLVAGASSNSLMFGQSTSNLLFQQVNNINGIGNTVFMARFITTNIVRFSGFLTTVATAGNINLQIKSALASNTITVNGGISTGLSSYATFKKVS